MFIFHNAVSNIGRKNYVVAVRRWVGSLQTPPSLLNIIAYTCPQSTVPHLNNELCSKIECGSWGKRSWTKFTVPASHVETRLGTVDHRKGVWVAEY